MTIHGRNFSSILWFLLFTNKMGKFFNSKSQNLIRHQMQALNHAKMQPNFAQQQAFLQQQILIQKLAMQNLQQVNRTCS